MGTKPNILIFIDWFWPGYLAGGPVQSILSLVSYLNNDFNFKIITTNRDLNCTLAYPEIESNKWISSELNCEVYYADPDLLNYESMKRIMDACDFDLVYINSFFSKNFSIIPLQILNRSYKAKPVVFAPRGMLGEGALAIKKIKKRAFIWYAKISGLHNRVIWHATSAEEAQEIKRVINPKTKIVQISNLPKKIKLLSDKEKVKGQLRACFMSRVSEKKNLLYALEVLAKVKDVHVSYTIYGPLEDKDYWEKCQLQIEQLPANINAQYVGSVAPKDIEQAFVSQHIMFLPTLNENFGHSIVESLLCGCPVIISDQTPWNDLEDYGAGFALPLNTPEKFADAILAYANMEQAEFSKASKQAIKYISSKIDLKQILDQYKNLFNGRT